MATTAPPLPDEPTLLSGHTPMFLRYFGAHPGTGSTNITAELTIDGPKFVWLRATCPLIAGTPLTPTVRAVMAADFTNPLVHWGDQGLQFINSDYTVNLARLPEGDYVSLHAATHISSHGVAAAAATLFDHRGPIGLSTASGLVSSTFTLRQE